MFWTFTMLFYTQYHKSMSSDIYRGILDIVPW